MQMRFVILSLLNEYDDDDDDDDDGKSSQLSSVLKFIPVTRILAAIGSQEMTIKSCPVAWQNRNVFSWWRKEAACVLMKVASSRWQLGLKPDILSDLLVEINSFYTLCQTVQLCMSCHPFWIVSQNIAQRLIAIAA